MANCEYRTKNNDCPGLNFCAHKGEDAEKKILELEQHVKVLVAGLRKLADMQIVEQFEIIEPLLDESKTAAQIERGHASRNNKVDMHEDLNNAYSVLIGMSHLLDLKAFNADLLSGRSFLSRMVDSSNYPPLPKESKE